MHELHEVERRDDAAFEIRITYRAGRYRIEMNDEGDGLVPDLPEYPFQLVGDQPDFDSAWVDMCHPALREPVEGGRIAPPQPQPARRKPLLRLVIDNEGGARG